MQLVADKFARAQEAGLIPVLCVGETLEERLAGTTEAVIGRQLGAVVDRLGVAVLEHAVVAYEPVWAIGTGQTATPDQAQAVHELHPRQDCRSGCYNRGPVTDPLRRQRQRRPTPGNCSP